MFQFHDAINEMVPASIIPFELHSKGDKRFVFMPLIMPTLETLPSLTGDSLARFYNDLSVALEYIHGLGFAHMDVKPSNILITSTGNFVLADLGSVAKFDEKTNSTPAYLPREIYTTEKISSSKNVDWWMLAMILFEKACNGDIHGVQTPNKQTVVNKISNIEGIDLGALLWKLL
jgi:serine/threonine protein kinase